MLPEKVLKPDLDEVDQKPGSVCKPELEEVDLEAQRGARQRNAAAAQPQRFVLPVERKIAVPLRLGERSWVPQPNLTLCIYIYVDICISTCISSYNMAG